MPLWPPYDVEILDSELSGPLEVCGLPQEVPNGLQLGERATLFTFKLTPAFSP